MEGLNNYQAVEKEQQIPLLKGEQQQNQTLIESIATRSRVVVTLVALLFISGVVIFQAGGYGSKTLRRDGSFATQAVVKPGDTMKNFDEIIVNDRDSSGTAYTEVTSKYKMVFVNGDIWLYAKLSATTTQTSGNGVGCIIGSSCWAVSYSDLGTNFGCGCAKGSWGTPYWKFSEHEQSSDSSTKIEFSGTVNGYNVGILSAQGFAWSAYKTWLQGTQTAPGLAYGVGTSTAIKSGATAFDSNDKYAYVVFKDKVNGADVTQFEFRSYASTQWSCDKVAFIIGTDGHLILESFSTTTGTACKSYTFFMSGSYCYIKGTATC